VDQSEELDQIRLVDDELSEAAAPRAGISVVHSGPDAGGSPRGVVGSSTRSRPCAHRFLSDVPEGVEEQPHCANAFPANRLLAAATLDRLRHNAYCLVIEGKSNRDPKVAPQPRKSTQSIVNPPVTTY
jgi:hypothetical protein